MPMKDEFIQLVHATEGKTRSDWSLSGFRLNTFSCRGEPKKKAQQAGDTFTLKGHVDFLSEWLNGTILDGERGAPSAFT